VCREWKMAGAFWKRSLLHLLHFPPWGHLFATWLLGRLRG
jgi:hypothetical protein